MDVKPDLKSLEEASRWYARLLAPDCTAADRVDFAAWHADPLHAQAYAMAQRLSETLSRATGHPRLQALASSALSFTDSTPSAECAGHAAPATRAHRWLRPAALAAGFAMLAVAIAWFAESEGPAMPAVTTYQTTPGERQTFTLEDGTIVQADVASRLTVAMSGTGREVELLAGRALFSVAHDPTRPFAVRAHSTRTVALGTRFQVQHRQEAVLVTLTEGSVVVSGGAGNSAWQDKLVPGEQLTFDTSAASPRKLQVDPELVTSWSRGRLLFRGQRLAEALEEINRYSPTQVRLGDPTLAELQVGGNFIAGDSRTIVSAFAAVLPLTVVERGDELVLFRRNDTGS